MKGCKGIIKHICLPVLHHTYHLFFRCVIWIKSEKSKFWKKKKRNSLSLQLSQSEREDKKYYSKIVSKMWGT